MQKPIVLITGASGMLGRALTNRLASDYRVVGLDVTDPPDDTALDSFLEMDVTSPASVTNAFDEIRSRYGDRLAAVVHLAAYYDFSGAESDLYDEVTIRGTERVLSALRSFRLDRFVFSSTMLVHAPVKPGSYISETSPLDARWAYPRSKVKTERLILNHGAMIPSTRLRIAGVYTDDGTQPTLVHQITRIYERDLKGFFFPGDSDAGQSLVHIDDVIDAMASVIERRDRIADGPVLIGEPDPPSYARLQEELGTLIWGREWPTIRVPESAAKAAAWIEEHVGSDGFIKPYMIELADDHYALDIGRARSQLGWTPRHRLLDDLPEIVSRLREDPVSWYERNGLEAVAPH